MSKTLQRLLIFFIGIPLVVFIVCLNFANHIAMQLLAFAATVIGTIEMHNILGKKLDTQPLPLVIVLTLIIPVVTYFYVLFDLSYNVVILVTLLSAFVSLAVEIFSYDRETLSFEKSLQRIASTLFILFYCGYLVSFITRMAKWEHCSAYTATFLVMVFGCDSIAWFFGMLLGKGNRGVFKVSPNKSIMGFIGGVAGSCAATVICCLAFSAISLEQLPKMLFIAACVSITAIAGDLIESVFKRSADVKDSGNVIPGRGGILDCLDSILISAPLYYLLVTLFFGM